MSFINRPLYLTIHHAGVNVSPHKFHIKNNDILYFTVTPGIDHIKCKISMDNNTYNIEQEDISSWLVGTGDLSSKLTMYMASLSDSQLNTIQKEYINYVNDGIISDGFISGLSAYMVMCFLINNGMIPGYQLNIPSDNIINTNMFNYISVALRAFSTMNLGWFSQLSRYVEIFINVWEGIFIAGSKIKVGSYAQLSVDIIAGMSQHVMSQLQTIQQQQYALYLALQEYDPKHTQGLHPNNIWKPHTSGIVLSTMSEDLEESSDSESQNSHSSFTDTVPIRRYVDDTSSSFDIDYDELLRNASSNSFSDSFSHTSTNTVSASLPRDNIKVDEKFNMVAHIKQTIAQTNLQRKEVPIISPIVPPTEIKPTFQQVKKLPVRKPWNNTVFKSVNNNRLV